MAGVFEGLRVLDLSWGIAGPMTTMLLVDNGAEVTRIEPPGGDPFHADSGSRVWSRGKRSARLDLADDHGKRIFRALASRADIVVDSFSPGTMARLGIDHASLSDLNPRVITCSITGYGERGRHRDRPGYDGLVAAKTGLLYDQRGRRGTVMEYLSGRPGPEPDFDAPEGMVRGAERPGPVFPRTTWPSIGATYLATLGIAAALRARQVSGVGQRVTTSLFQGALAAVCLNWQRVENPDAPLYWMWPADSRAVDGLYECSDGRWVHHWTIRPRWVLESAEGDRLEPATIEGAYRDDPDRLSMESNGLLAGMFLHPLLTEAFKKFPSTEWEKAAESAGVGVAAVRSPAESLTDNSFLTDGCVVEIEDPEVGTIRHAGVLMDFSLTPGEVTGPSPGPGEHTGEVVAEAERMSDGDPSPTLQHPRSERLDHPLQRVRVLDLGLGVAGPFTGRMLADLGADVIKVDALYDGFWNGTHMGLGTNRGKRSIALDLKTSTGHQVLERLIERADVITTNWRPGVAARLGIDYESLRDRYPGLVYCNTRGYEKGPRSELPGTNQNAAALTGGEWEDGACAEGNPPMWSRSSMGDTGNGLLAAIAITAALYHRERTGQGQAVSTSIVNAGLLQTSYAWIHADGSPGDWRHIDGDQLGLGPFYRLYRCADGDWIFVAAVSTEQRERFLTAAGVSVADDVGADELGSRLSSAIEGRRSEEWVTLLDGVGVPVEAVDEQFCRNLFDDPEMRDEQLVVGTWSAHVGRFEDPGLLVNVSPATSVVQRGPCACGEHTREILGELGYSEREITKLVAEGTVLDGSTSTT